MKRPRRGPDLTSAPDAHDSRHLEIDGRRWRRSDPTIPEPLRQELVNELMSARRAVAAAVDARDLAAARRRVHHAKHALGERGRAWWLEPREADRDVRIDAAILALLRSRSEGASICPSEPARIVGGGSWRTLMRKVRQRAADLSRRGHISIVRRGHILADHPTTGILRYRLNRT